MPIRYELFYLECQPRRFRHSNLTQGWLQIVHGRLELGCPNPLPLQYCCSRLFCSVNSRLLTWLAMLDEAEKKKRYRRP